MTLEELRKDQVLARQGCIVQASPSDKYHELKDGLGRERHDTTCSGKEEKYFAERSRDGSSKQYGQASIVLGKCETRVR